MVWFKRAVGHFEGGEAGIPCYCDLNEEYLFPTIFFAHFNGCPAFNTATLELLKLEIENDTEEKKEEGI